MANNLTTREENQKGGDSGTAARCGSKAGGFAKLSKLVKGVVGRSQKTGVEKEGKEGGARKKPKKTNNPFF